MLDYQNSRQSSARVAAGQQDDTGAEHPSCDLEWPSRATPDSCILWQQTCVPLGYEGWVAPRDGTIGPRSSAPAWLLAYSAPRCFVDATGANLFTPGFYDLPCIELHAREVIPSQS